MDNENRGNLYLITGVVLGLVIGLLISWVIQPVEYTDTSPSSLKETYKDRYRAVIASAFDANGDIVRAKARLELLGDENIHQALAEQAQQSLAEDNSPLEAQVLGRLAGALSRELPDIIPTETTSE